MTEFVKSANVPAGVSTAESPEEFVSTGTPGNFMQSNPKPVVFTSEFIESLDASARELSEAIAKIPVRRRA